MSKEQTPIYKYHIHLLIYDNYTNFYHSFNSNSEILKTSEIREQLKEKKPDVNSFLVANIVRTIND